MSINIGQNKKLSDDRALRQSEDMKKWRRQIDELQQDKCFDSQLLSIEHSLKQPSSFLSKIEECSIGLQLVRVKTQRVRACEIVFSVLP